MVCPVSHSPSGVEPTQEPRFPCCQSFPFDGSVFQHMLLPPPGLSFALSSAKPPCDFQDLSQCHLSTETPLVAEHELLCIFNSLLPSQSIGPHKTYPDLGKEIRSLHKRKAFATKDQ